MNKDTAKTETLEILEQLQNELTLIENGELFADEDKKILKLEIELRKRKIEKLEKSLKRLSNNN